jgi:lipopolysaccharide export system permease protein
MKKLDWYIIYKFISTFVFCILLFTSISVVVDLSEKTDDFVNSKLSTSEIIRTYYFGFVPFIISFLFPLFVFIAVIFFTSRMALRSEIIAILASGVSFARFLRPYLIGGLLLAAILWWGNRSIVPRANELRTSFEARYVNTQNTSFRSTPGIYMRVDSFTYCGFRSYDTLNKSGNGFFLHRIKNNKVVYNARAEIIAWDTARKQWKLSSVVERTINGLHEEVTMTNEKYITTSYTPRDLQKDEFMKNRLTTPELNRMIQLEKLRGGEIVKELQVEKYRRDATPVTVIILTLIGGILSSRRIRGGSGYHLAVGMLMCAAFILFDRFSTIFSSKGDFPPLLAAWTPNIIFTFVTYYLYRKAPK